MCAAAPRPRRSARSRGARGRTGVARFHLLCAPCAELGAASARVARDLFGRSDDRAPGDGLAERVVASARAEWKTGRADAVGAPLAEGVLHQPVLPRVI